MATISEKDYEHPVYHMSVKDMGLSTRTLHCLVNTEHRKFERIDTPGQVIQQAKESLLERPNVGRYTLLEINNALARVGRAHGLILELGSKGEGNANNSVHVIIYRNTPIGQQFERYAQMQGKRFVGGVLDEEVSRNIHNDLRAGQHFLNLSKKIG